MEDKPTAPGRELPRTRTPKAAFSTPEQPVERKPRKSAQAPPPVAFQPPPQTAEPSSAPPDPAAPVEAPARAAAPSPRRTPNAPAEPGAEPGVQPRPAKRAGTRSKSTRAASAKKPARPAAAAPRPNSEGPGTPAATEPEARPTEARPTEARPTEARPTEARPQAVPTADDRPVTPPPAEPTAGDGPLTRPTEVEPTRTDAPAARPTEAWAKLVADPGHAPELLAMAAVQTVGPRAADWAARIRDQYPAASDDAVAALAIRQFTRFGSLSSVFGAVAGSYAPLLLLAAAAVTHAELILHVAAAYRLDPVAEERAVDLLVLSRVHADQESAAAALTAARQPAYEQGGVTAAAWRLGRMAATQAGEWTAVRMLSRFFPGTGLLAATLAGRAAAEHVAHRARAYYRRAGGEARQLSRGGAG